MITRLLALVVCSRAFRPPCGGVLRRPGAASTARAVTATPVQVAGGSSGAGAAARLARALPRRDALDARVANVTVPQIASLAVFPLVGAVDTFWIGRMGDAPSLAGMGAANTAFSTLFFVVAVIPQLTAPLVASATASGDADAAARVVGEAVFVACALGLVGTAALSIWPARALSLVLPPGALALAPAASYLRLRALGMLPALLTSVGFAAFRGMLDTRTPLYARASHGGRGRG